MARLFDGSDDQVIVGYYSAMQVNQCTIVLFSYCTAATAQETSFGSNLSPGTYSLRCAGSAVSFAIYDGSWEWKTGADATGLNAWHGIGCTFTSAKKVKVFHDGLLDSSGESTFTKAIPAINSDSYIGRTPAGYGSTTFTGRIAEVAVWNIPMSDAEVMALTLGAHPLRFRPTNLVFYFPLWGVAATEPNLSGYAYHGAVTGAVLANHAPVGRYAPYRYRAFPAIVGIEYINVTDSGVGTDTVLSVQEWLTITDTGLGTDAAYLLGEVLIDGLRLDHALRIRVGEPTNVASKPISSGLPTRIYLGKQGRTLEIEGWVPTVAELNTITALADGAVHEVQLPTGSRVSVHIPDVNPVRPIEPGKYPYMIRAVERMD
jgi:hypothetical protein